MPTAPHGLAPRMGFGWSPSGIDKKTVVRGGAGVFYDHVPLNVFAFEQYPQQVITTFASVAAAPQGSGALAMVLGGPNLALVHRGHHGFGKLPFAPHSTASSLEVEHVVNRLVKLQAKLSYLDSDGLIMVVPATDASGQESF